MKKLSEVITEATWQKGTRGWGRGCLAVHLCSLGLDHDGWIHALCKLEHARRMLFPERGHSCVEFNDHPDTTLDDVLRVCKFADV
jgi:hypothetical protein